ncbi:ABC transporter permease [Methylocaldum marinum]|uniref:ABC transporter permease n=1 Tax=Methylocaldum marinum TaxID=1432792 RepID=A0A250KNZ1_9GAMM|nr:ABC transporter permease [Methylocaldum marinum]BBA33403.1 ABC transporter permease [Methylocaldum marinum]
MAQQSPDKPFTPSIERATVSGHNILTLKGGWNVRGLATEEARLAELIHGFVGDDESEWDIREVTALDSAGAFLLWRAWGGRLPRKVYLRPEQESTFTRLQNRPAKFSEPMDRQTKPIGERIGLLFSSTAEHFKALVSMLGQLILDVGRVLRHPRDIPLREISAAIHETGGRALGITALVGFLIGIVVSYLSSLQLQTFGAQIYIVNILGLSIIRELGPLLAAILVAGRSGSAMTARIGVMRVTQELDALEALGISRSLRLIFPKVLALTIALPLLVVWTDAIALVGGAIAAHFELGVGYYQFFMNLPDAVPVSNFAIGFGKGAVFGLFIALLACHFGMRIEPNTESLGNETTRSVVASITLVILIDAVFAILFRNVGL